MTVLVARRLFDVAQIARSGSQHGPSCPRRLRATAVRGGPSRTKSAHAYHWALARRGQSLTLAGHVSLNEWDLRLLNRLEDDRRACRGGTAHSEVDATRLQSDRGALPKRKFFELLPQEGVTRSMGRQRIRRQRRRGVVHHPAAEEHPRQNGGRYDRDGFSNHESDRPGAPPPAPRTLTRPTHFDRV